jgi:poly(hydroxyalkanoate) granule-associated protein
MARSKKSRKMKRTIAATAQERMLDAVHQVWLAGLGAVSKAQHGTPKLLEELITEGARVHASARGATQKAVRDTLSEVQSAVSERLGGVREKASDTYENLEKMFQTRVHRALTQLGVPSAEEVTALSKRVDALNANIDKLARSRKQSTRPNAVRKAVQAPVAVS